MTKQPQFFDQSSSLNLPGLAGKVCVITGGAGIIGQALCRGLVANQIRTAILDINPESASRLAQKLESETGVRCIGVEADVLSRDSLEQAKKIIETKLGQVDFLINGAGGNSPKATTHHESYSRDQAGDLADK